MSLESAHLSLRPWLPAQLLALIEEPERFEHLAGVPAAAGFKGPPDAAGMVEIAYGIVPSQEGWGYATEAATALTAFAFDSPRVGLIRAHTLPVANASTRVLAKCGFRLGGSVVDPTDGPVWRWERSR